MLSSMQLKLGSVAEFLDRKVLIRLVCGLSIGILTFCSEISFAYGIMVFLIKLGVSQQKLPQSLQFMADASQTSAILFMVVTTLFRGLAWWAQEYSGGSLEQSFRYVQRLRLVKSLMAGGEKSTADAISMFGEKATAASQALMSLQTATVSVFLAFAYLGTLMVMSWSTTLLTTGGLALALLPLTFIFRKVKRVGDGVNKEWDQVHRQMMLAFQNIFFVNVSGMLRSTQKAAEKNLTAYYQHHLTYHRAFALSSVAPQVIGIIILVLTSAYSAEHQFLATSLLLPYFYIYMRFVQVGSAASSRLSDITFKLPQMRELFKWWSCNKQLLQDFDVLQEGSLKNQRDFQGALGFQLKQACFRYEDESRNIFDHLDMMIPQGQCTILTGRSGTGKSTLLKLLLGFQEPNSGTVEILGDGKYFSSVSVKESLWRITGYVGAESYLISGTVRENLVFGNRNHVSEQDFNIALKLADCEFVFELKGGLSFVLGEGGEGLSTGQRQRLGLARAVLRQPKVLILDEFTANLDAQTQERLIESLKSLKGKTTLVIVTHRRELLRLADQHIDLDQLFPEAVLPRAI